MTPDVDTKARCFRGLLVCGNLVTACCGVALMAMSIFFITDHDGLYILVFATGNDGIWRGAWIGLFAGLALFCTSVFGVYAIVESNRHQVLAYLILMIIIYTFEMASTVTAATHKDWFVPNLFLKQMLQYYKKPLPEDLPSTQDQIYVINGITNTWNRIMTESKCCGVFGPEDWIKYDSSFREQYSDADYPWPRLCCLQDAMGAVSHLEGCKIGVKPFLHRQGCYDVIASPLILHSSGVSWFGFAILCFMFFMILGVIVRYTQLDY